MKFRLLGVRYSVIGNRYSVFGIRYSVFGIRYSVIGKGFAGLPNCKTAKLHDCTTLCSTTARLQTAGLQTANCRTAELQNCRTIPNPSQPLRAVTW